MNEATFVVAAMAFFVGIGAAAMVHLVMAHARDSLRERRVFVRLFDDVRVKRANASQIGYYITLGDDSCVMLQENGECDGYKYATRWWPHSGWTDSELTSLGFTSERLGSAQMNCGDAREPQRDYAQAK